MTDMPRSGWWIGCSCKTTCRSVDDLTRVGKEGIDGAFGRVSVIEVVELSSPGGVALGVRHVDPVKITQCVNDLTGRGEDRPGGVFGK